MSGKRFAHWLCILCWQSPAAFTVWWINPVDRLTCSHCDTLQNNILKQLLKSQLDITWKWFPSTPGEVQNLACQKIEHCTVTKWTECMCADSVWPWKIGCRNLPGRVFFSRNATAKTFNSWRDQRVGKGELLSQESQSSSNIIWLDVWVVNQWWIRMIFRRKFPVPKICCPRSIQASHACHKNHRSNEELSRLSF